jgi:GTPase SAR1 family protein
MDRTIKVIYHPVKKQIRFMVKEGGCWTEIIGLKSSLRKYFSQKGTVVLQDLGNDFFNAMIDSQSEPESIEILFKGTQMDFDDFINMVDCFNQYNQEQAGNSNKRNTLLYVNKEFECLPSVDNLYDDICSFYDNAISIFRNESDGMEESMLERCRDTIAKMESVEDEIQKDKNQINICVVGAYSSGKSTFINALVGNIILPTAVNPTTTKVFQVMNNYSVNIEFKMSKDGNLVPFNVIWNEKDHSFKIDGQGIVDGSVILKGLHSIVSGIRNMSLAEQTYTVLEFLNYMPSSEIIYESEQEEKSKEDVNGNIKQYKVISESLKHNGFYKEWIADEVCIHYPVSISNERFSFNIYDTPGSNNSISPDDFKSLKLALEDQTNSIVIVLFSYDNTSSKDNAILTQLLEQINQGNDRKLVNIDLDRSLYVISKVDGITKTSGFTALQNSVIVMENDVDGKNVRTEYLLSDRKLFFVSQYAACLLKSKKNGAILDEEEENFIEDNRNKLNRMKCYQYDKMAHSQYETLAIQKQCEEKVTNAENDDDMLFVNTGVYAVERAILNYAEKYALAVKSKTILDAINTAINKLQKEYHAVKYLKDIEKDELDEKIKETKKIIEKTVNNLYDEYKMDDGRKVGKLLENDDAFKKLTQTKLKEIINEAIKVIDKEKRGVHFNKNKLLKADNNVTKELEKLFDKYLSDFIKKREGIIRNIIRGFKNDISAKISENVPFANEVKEYLKDVTEPETSLNLDIEKLRNKFLVTWLGKNYKIEKENEFIKSLGTYTGTFKKNLINSVIVAIEDVKNQFIGNVTNLSKAIAKLQEDKESLDAELSRVKDKLDSYSKLYSELDEKIWGE